MAYGCVSTGLRTAPGNPLVITLRPATDHFVPIMNTSTVQLSQTHWHQKGTLSTVEKNKYMVTCKKFLSWSVAALVSIGQESHRISWSAVKILRLPPDLITIQRSRSSEKIFWFEPPLQPKAMYTSEFIQVVANTFTSKVNFTMQDMRKTASYRAIQLSSCLRRRQPRFLLQLRSTFCRRSGVARPTLSHLTTAFSTTQLTKQQHRNLKWPFPYSHICHVWFPNRKSLTTFLDQMYPQLMGKWPQKPILAIRKWFSHPFVGNVFALWVFKAGSAVK